MKVFTPEKSFEPSASGAIPRLPKSGELKFKTKADGYVRTLYTNVILSASFI